MNETKMPKKQYAQLDPSHNTPRNPQKLSATRVVLHQPLNCAIFWFLGLFCPKYERDSCIPPIEKRRTPLPGGPRGHFFGPVFRGILLLFYPNFYFPTPYSPPRYVTKIKSLIQHPNSLWATNYTIISSSSPTHNLDQ